MECEHPRLSADRVDAHSQRIFFSVTWICLLENIPKREEIQANTERAVLLTTWNRVSLQENNAKRRDITTSSPPRRPCTFAPLSHHPTHKGSSVQATPGDLFLMDEDVLQEDKNSWQKWQYQTQVKEFQNKTRNGRSTGSQPDLFVSGWEHKSSFTQKWVPKIFEPYFSEGWWSCESVGSETKEFEF